MKRAFFITLNEVRLYLTDKGDLAFSLLLPIVTFALIYGAFGGSTLFTATANVVDEDRGAYAAELIQKIDAVKGISIEKLTRAQADAKLERSDILLVLEIPAGFSDALASGKQVELIFKQRGNGGQAGQILASIIRGAAEDIDTKLKVQAQVEANLQGTNVSQERIGVVVEQYLQQEQQKPVVSVKEEVTGGSADIVNQYLPESYLI